MCQVQILSVNGIVPPGATNPTHLRVAGRLSQCPSGQVVVTSNVTAASPPTSPVYGAFGDGFIVVLPITAQNVTCGDINNPVSVRAECYQRPACYDDDIGPLKCCDVAISWFDAIVLPGSLTPSAIRVSGTSQGCASSPFLLNDPVIVRITTSSGAVALSGPVSVDALTGSFTAQLSIPAATLVQCDDQISVDAWCSTNPNCKAPTVTNRLDCPQCARADVRVVSAGQCAGMPPKQPITLGATINIAKGAKRYFKWSYGDGTMSPVFEIDNSAGSATTPHTVPPYPPPVPPNPAVSPSHDYSPGSYSAELIVTDAQGNPLECDKIPLPVVASCNPCPGVTVSATPPGPCVNGKRKVTLLTQVNSLPAATAFQWLFGDGQQGLAQAATAPGAWPMPANPAINEHDYAPGTYTATLANIVSPACPPVTVRVTVDPCEDVCCPEVTIDLPQEVDGQSQPEVTGCAPTSAVATFKAKLSWMAGCTPVAPTSFEWTLNGPGGKKYQKSTNLPTTDTTTGWKDPGGNPAVVQFTVGGSYSVSVIAIIPGVSLPCNPTDTASFKVPACCPQLIGPLNASEKMGDQCTWLFSAQVSNPNNAPVTFEWSFHDGTTATTSVPQTEHTYTPVASTTGMTTVTLKSPNCPDTGLSARVTHRCVCPTIATPNAVVTGCVPGPGTAPGTPPTVVLSTSVSPPVATSFDWTVTTPGGTSFTKTTTAASTTDGTADGAWTDTSTGAAGVLNLGASGGYAVTVRAKGPSISPTCPQPPAMSFTVPICPCPPGMARDASGVCVPTASTTPSCTIWCILAGIFFIAIPISAYISTAAHCLLGAAWNIALQGGIIATAIGIFIGLCGICCLWIFLLIGSALGVVATLIAAYWLGFPACWYIALPILIGFIALGIGMAARCGWRIR